MDRTGIAKVAMCLGIGFVVNSCDKKAPTSEEASKVASFLNSFEMDGELPDVKSVEWPDYEFWVEGFGVERFLNTLPLVEKIRPELQDECEFFRKEIHRDRLRLPPASP